MIDLKDNANCCGCEACAQICPKECISLNRDVEGFLYPKVNIENCIKCGLCENVCPVIHQDEKREPKAIYAAKNPDEKVRKESSSGGLFTMLAESVINRGGVVFGARWNEQWEVIHDYVETPDVIALFRGSKYVQSRIGDNYKKAKQFLQEGRQVLFTGTPCQVAGLRRFLRKEYENLLLVDFICHGVPSPLVWKRYLQEIIKKRRIGTIQSIDFRDKSEGWSNYCFNVKGSNSSFSEGNSANIYMRGFVKDLYLRPSCHSCPTKKLKSGSDITIADFWGISAMHPEFDNNKGVNLVVVNTTKGVDVYKILDLDCIISDKRAFKFNPSISHSSPKHKDREAFFYKVTKSSNEIMPLITRATKDSILLRIKLFLWRLKTSLFN